MSRSGYTDEEDYPGQFDLYRANVNRSLASKRGQAFLVEMAKALDEMPRKRIFKSVLVESSEETGEVEACAMGAVALHRKLDTADVDAHDPDEVATLFGISRVMAAEIAYVNDECALLHERTVDGFWKQCAPEMPEQAWARVRKWVDENIRKAP